MPILIVLLIMGGVALAAVLTIIVKGILTPKQISTIQDNLKTGKTAQAIKIAKHLLTKDPRNTEAHYFLGLAYLAEAKPELALMEFKTVNQIGNFVGYLNERQFRKKIADLYQRFEQDEEALKEYLVLIKLEPEEPENYYQAGFIFEQRHKNDHAVKFYKKTLELDPRHSNAHLRLGLLLFRAKRVLEAKSELETALRFQPENHAANYYLGKILKDGHDYTGALLAFERAQKDPDLKIKSLIERGGCFINQKNYERAATELERAIKFSTDDADNDILHARYFLAHCYEKTRNIEKAIGEWEKIYSKKPTFKDVAEKLSAFQDLRLDDKVKDYVTSNKNDFLTLCQKLTFVMGLSVQDSKEISNGVQIVSIENDSEKWRNTRKMPKLMWFLRVSSNIDESTVRDCHEVMKATGAHRAMIITNTSFHRSALAYAESRPMDLLNKDKLHDFLHKVEL